MNNRVIFIISMKRVFICVVHCSSFHCLFGFQGNDIIMGSYLSSGLTRGLSFAIGFFEPQEKMLQMEELPGMF